MSIENLKEYARRCAAEPELRDSARALGASDIGSHIEHAANLGLDWTEDDMVAFRKEVLDAEGDFDSLSEEELEQIAGGAALVGIAIAAAVAAATGAVVAGGVAGTTAGGVSSAAGHGGW